MIKIRSLDKDSYLLYRKDFTLLVNTKNKTFITSKKFDGWKTEDIEKFSKHQLDLLRKQYKLVKKYQDGREYKRLLFIMVFFPTILVIIMYFLGLLQ